ncbi:MAG: type II secretion system F family protein [Candidatus Firestonebacteria bacterium]
MPNNIIKQIEVIKNKINSLNIRPVSLHDLSTFVRQLATMCAAGVPLYQAIHTLYDGMDESQFKPVLFSIKEKIKSGTNFSQCLTEYPKVFPPLMASLVKVGEVTGLLEKALAKYADLLEWEEEFKSKLVTMMIYPLMMLLVGTAVLVFILAVILPRFVAIFSDFNQALPWPTLILLKTSNIFMSYWWLILIIITVLTILLIKYYKTKKGKYLFDKNILKAPLFGNAIHKSLLSRFSFVLSVTVGSGVPLLQALSVTGETISSSVLSGYIKEITKRVERGDSLSKALKEYVFFPKQVVQMVNIGEETGKLEDVLNQIATFYEREMEIIARRVVIVLEPIIILGMAVVVGFVAIAVLLPILSLSTVIK